MKLRITKGVYGEIPLHYAGIKGQDTVMLLLMHSYKYIRLPQLWFCVGTILPASRPGGQAWYLPRVPVQWTLPGQHRTGVFVCMCVWCVYICVHVCMPVCVNGNVHLLKCVLDVRVWVY